MPSLRGQPSAVESVTMLCLDCLVSCKINTLLYIFRDQKKKSAAIGFKIFILNTFPKPTPESILNILVMSLDL